MEGKKKLKRILIPIIVVVLVATAITSFFVIRNKKKDAPSIDNPASNVLNTNERLDLDIFNSWTNLEYSSNYNGNYKYSSVLAINFNPELTEEQVLYLCGSNDYNGFVYQINLEKTRKTKRETISIVDGQYSRSVKYFGVQEVGYFYGNDNRSYLYVEDLSGNLITRQDGQDYLYEISNTGYNLFPAGYTGSNSSKTQLYITEHIFSTKNPSLELYSVTYIYEMIDVPQNTIPNSNLG